MYKNKSQLKTECRERLKPLHKKAFAIKPEHSHLPSSQQKFWEWLLSHSVSLPRKYNELAKLDSSAQDHFYLAFRQNPQTTKPQAQVGLATNSAFVSISWLNAAENVFNAVSSLESDLKVVLRNVSSDQLKAYRSSVTNSAGLIKCEVTEQFYKPDEIHIDHYPTSFDTIANNWLNTVGITFYAADIIKTYQDDPNHNTFADDSINKAWYEYHKRFATLRAVNKQINMSLGKHDKEAA